MTLTSKITHTLIQRGLAIILFCIVYQLLTSYNVIVLLQFDTLPSISEILRVLPETITTKTFATNIISSVSRVFTGVVIAMSISIPLGILASISKRFMDYIIPFVELFRPIPNVAWVPIAVLLFPKAESSIIFITCIGAFFPILLNTLHGAQHIPRKYLHNARMLKLNKLEIIRYVYLPGALPLIITGITIGTGTSWLGVIVAESTYGRNGIGYFTFQSLQLVDYENIIIGMMTIGILGTLSTIFIRLLSRNLLRWQRQEVHTGI